MGPQRNDKRAPPEGGAKKKEGEKTNLVARCEVGNLSGCPRSSWKPGSVGHTCEPACCGPSTGLSCGRAGCPRRARTAHLLVEIKGVEGDEVHPLTTFA